MPTVLSENDDNQIIQQLGHLGFKPAQIKTAAAFLSKPSALTSSLLSSLSPLEASIEYLILHVPECDLPERFLPSNNSSNPFITSTHSGTDDLKKRWIEDKAIKEAGWPAHIVKQCTSDVRLLESWELLIAALGKKLIGEDPDTLFALPLDDPPNKIIISEEEAKALGARYVDPLQLVMPLYSGPISLHILLSHHETYPLTGYPSIYITSNSVPPYIRLHLLSKLLHAIQGDCVMEPGEGFCMGAMRILEDEWASIEDHGPPDMSVVMQHLILRPDVPMALGIDLPMAASKMSTADKSRKTGRAKRDDRSDQQIKDEFEILYRSDEYTKIFATRKTLPAFSARDEFLNMLEKNRVIVVVGETGDVIHSMLRIILV